MLKILIAVIFLLILFALLEESYNVINNQKSDKKLIALVFSIFVGMILILCYYYSLY